MSKDKSPVTPAIRVLRTENVRFTEYPYQYIDHGGTANFVQQYHVDEHAVIKTLIMEDETKRPMVVLMHGDREVSTKELARTTGVKTIQPCTPDTAQKHSGYMVGGTSPFGTRKAMPVYMEETILELSLIYINGGKRGYLIGVDPQEIVRVLRPVLVNVGIQ